MRRPLKKKRVMVPDAKYGSAKVGRLINYVMERGQKQVARKIVYQAFDEIQKAENKDPQLVFEEALQNVGPLTELRSRRVGGANYQIPQEVSPDRRLVLALRWILQAAKSRKGIPMYKKLSREIIDASKNEGAAITRRENTQKMAEANRAFAHLAW
ncbi:MAG: 30S ribosomal protein S7 [Candidatus Kaiserbacteria bacterium]|nr:30S ribosomal protein S7 [Candidatus Kaiserbacteria bacterium]